MFRGLTLSLIIASFIIGAFAQSQTADCYRCPPEDQLGFAVAEKDETSDPIFCSYPAVEGEDPYDFYCTYSKVCSSTVAWVLLFTFLSDHWCPCYGQRRRPLRTQCREHMLHQEEA